MSVDKNLLAVASHGRPGDFFHSPDSDSITTPYASPSTTPYGSLHEPCERGDNAYNDAADPAINATQRNGIDGLQLPVSENGLLPNDAAPPGENAGQGPGNDDGSDSTEKTPFFKSLNGKQIATLVTLCCGNISAAMFYSLLAPFFPTEARNKGLSEMEVGIIFGLFQLINFLLSPIFGYFMGRIGSKFMFVAGNFVCSGCAILFGILLWCPPGWQFLMMCCIVRSVEAVAASAMQTATSALGAYTFPKHISTVMGMLQASSCAGLMSGPPLGGLLYSVGGYYLPFAVTGGVFMLFSLLSFFILPSPTETNKPQDECNSRLSKLQLLRQPIVLIVGYLVLVGQTAIGFMDVSLATHLNDIQSGLSEIYVGLIFLIPASLVVMLAPVYGYINDRNKALGRPMMIFGTLVGMIGFLGLGPSPIVPFLPQKKLWLVIVSLVVAALGWGTMVVTYQEFVSAAKKRGFADDMDTQGVIAGVNGAFNSLGALLGPVVGGVLLDAVHFPWASTIIAGAVGLASVNMFVYMVAVASCRCCCHHDEDDEAAESNQPDEPLLRNS